MQIDTSVPLQRRASLIWPVAELGFFALMVVIAYIG